jgi:hypothetical protein
VSPRLPTIGQAFNEKVKGYVATVQASQTSTDRKLGDTRLVHKGKGRRGTSIVIRNLKGEKVFDYDTSVHPYRTAREAARYIADLWGPIWHPDIKPKNLVCFKCRAVENDSTRGRFTNTIIVTGAVLCPDCSKRYG